MAHSRRRNAESALNVWPGYVDALSTLLMVVIFVLLVFVLVQAFLSAALTSRDEALEKVSRQLAEMTDMLALERGQARDLQLTVARLREDVQAASAERDALGRQLGLLQETQAQTVRERDQLQARLAEMTDMLALERGQARDLQLTVARLREDVQTASAERDATGRQLGLLQETQTQTAREREQLLVRLAEMARLREELLALQALRAELEQKIQDAAARAMTEAERRTTIAAQLAEERNLADSTRARIALLTREVEAMRAQLAGLARVLELTEQSARDKDTQIANLGARLNAALAAKVEELQRYRSEFFGRLRDVMAGRPGVQVVGDRFMFQSEVLFPVGSALLSPAGQEQVAALAQTIRTIGEQIPANLGWVLRVDGHADRTRLTGHRGYATNWELSAARAITVVKQLIVEGVDPAHLAAAGFGEHQPIDPADTPAAYARNRRIELRLTDR